MKKNVQFTLAALAFTFSTQTFANDCGWSSLTEGERQSVQTGQTAIRSDFSKGIRSFSIDQYAFSKNESVFSATANFYNISAYPDVSIVEKTVLADGERSSNNPVLLDVIPKEGNPFGGLYQPFTYELSVHPKRETYEVTIDYLTSPNLINDLVSHICFVKIKERVFVAYKSQFEGNPKIGFQTPGFGVEERIKLWRAVFQNALDRVSLPSDSQNNKILEKALLGINE